MVYKVVKGDTLLKIAATHKTTPADIMKLNPIIKDPGHIEIGWELKMPDTDIHTAETRSTILV